MNIMQAEHEGASRIDWEPLGSRGYPSGSIWNETVTTASVFTTQDGLVPHSLYMCPEAPMAMAHEIGHLLSSARFNIGRYIFSSNYAFKLELMAWRIAKSIMKPELWDEKVAKKYLRTYYIGVSIRVNWKKLRIVPLNKGIRLRRLDTPGASMIE